MAFIHYQYPDRSQDSWVL